MDLVSAQNPRYTEDNRIMLDVKFNGWADYLPFLADPNDVEQHGKDIFTRAQNGEFGTVVPFDPQFSAPGVTHAHR